MARRKRQSKFGLKDKNRLAENRLDELRSLVYRIKCKSEFCETLVEVDGLTARHPRGVYCEDCRSEAKQIYERNYYANRRKYLRQKQRVQTA